MKVHTSGTTGTPKVFHLSAKQYQANLDRLSLVRGPEFLTLKSLFVCWSKSEAATLRYQHYCAKKKIAFFASSGIASDIALLRSRTIDGIIGNPIDLLRYAQAGVHRFRYIVSAGYLLKATDARSIRLKLLAENGAAYVSYGISELGPCTALGTFAQAEAIEGCVGSPCAGSQIRIVDGEVQARTPTMISRYVSDLLTAKHFTADGWFRTGDLGYMTPDNVLVIKGRIK